MRRILIVVAAVACAATIAPATSGATAGEYPGYPSTHTLAVIGDTPYGDPQIANFAKDIAAINADPDVRFVIHLGDIKNGSSRCDDSYFSLIRSDFDTFADPLVYTPGDNEWTDCHRANNGAYNPLERLAKLRSVFFDDPGEALGGGRLDLAAQHKPFVENVRWRRWRTVFATLNVPGSNNDLAPWFANTAPTEAQLDEYQDRLEADLKWIDRTFKEARKRHAAAVVIGLQADMWDPAAVAANQTSGFNEIVGRLAQRAHSFRRPVLLLEGDSHVFLVDHPLANGSPVHGVTTKAPNVTRIVVEGSTSVPHEWLRLHVDPDSKSVFSWENVPFAP
jgi:Calcineurin-like phosphoesterase